MKKLWRTIGKIGFWVAWPALFIYLRIGKRTRVFIKCGDELLVAKGWLGNDSWIYPGGGLHFREDPVKGAIRETYEETGIMLKPDQLEFLFEKQISTPQKMSFKCIAYGVELNEKPELKPAKIELVALEWRPISELLKQPSSHQLLEPALSIWGRLV